MLILERNHQNDDKKPRALTMTVTFMRGGCHIKSQLARLVFWTCIAWLSPLSPLPTTDHSRLLRQDGDNDQNNNVDNDEALKIYVANMTKTMKKIFMNLLLQKVGCENAQGCQLVTTAINIKSIHHFFSSFLGGQLGICQR